MPNTIVPVSGWMLDEIVHLDEALPGFAASYLRASAERRQVVAAYVSTLPRGGARKPSVATLLARANHEAILGAAYGHVPAGLRGALGRSGPQPHNRRFYTLLYNLLSNPRLPEIARAIRQAQKIDAGILTRLRKLPPPVCSPNVAKAVLSKSGAHDLTALLGLLIDHDIDSVSLFDAVRRVTGHRQLIERLTRWTLKVAMPAHPVPASSCYRPLTSAADLHACAVRYQNCLRQYLVDALNGFHAFAEVVPRAGQRGLVVHLQRYDTKWMIQGLFGVRNSPPRRELRDLAIIHLRKHGLDEVRWNHSPEGPWSALTRLGMPGFYDFGF